MYLLPTLANFAHTSLEYLDICDFKEINLAIFGSLRNNDHGYLFGTYLDLILYIGFELLTVGSIMTTL